MGMDLIFLDHLWGGDSGGHKEKLSGDIGLSAGWICSYVALDVRLNSATGVGGRAGYSAIKFDRYIYLAYHIHVEQLDFLFACARVFT